ncbi:hypothetical protein E3E11_02940 [Oecophyllibacter saccharovorans]|uniref:hypothetical protein n=1 Tax=Oecophyllibacter saccharovorans TaxID=2558360 RepID=UPI001144D20E|nr:hypothetical protein [Oecophyllibacter saccharovorans]QDH14993.1 hypothetical protein E3E11_02940 [Oecophyllibacter saccharovorans]
MMTCFRIPAAARSMLSLAFLALPLAVPYVGLQPAPAYATGAPTDVDDPTLNRMGRDINRVLVILRQDHSYASQRCLTGLAEMHKAEHELDRIHNRNDPDLALVHDVLGSTMEEALRACGTDATALCARSANANPNLAAACQHLPAVPAEDSSLDAGEAGASLLSGG